MTVVESGIRQLYEQIIAAWNRRDAVDMAAPFAENGSIVGFDGSPVDGREAIETHLRPIFADHPTAAYVARVRAVRAVSDGVALLRAEAGMVPPGGAEPKPALNTIHSLVARRNADGWS